MPRWVQVDCRDMSWTRAKESLCRVRIDASKGDLIEVVSTLRNLQKELGVWCDKMGDSLHRMERNGEVVVAQLEVANSITDCP